VNRMVITLRQTEGRTYAPRTRALGGRLLLAFAIALSFVMTAGQAAFGQTDEGAITGLVLDTTNAVVPGAQVTLTSVDTGLVLQTVTSSSGNYTFSPVKIGNYRVEAKASGFGTVTQNNLQLHLQQRLEVNMTLSVGTVSSQVDVSTAPPLLQTEEASVGQEISEKTIADTPLNGRNYVYIAQLTAGVSPVTGARGGSTGDFSANGQGAGANNFILDGIDNNSSVVDFLNSASYNVKPPPDALSEFRVQTSNYSAEFGHSAGAVVNVSIKAGTNKIHGSVWEFLRNTSLDNKDWNFTYIPPYHQNQFGAALGFPIFKNKLFFFGDVEANRIATIDTTNTFTVPTAKERTGDFSDLNLTSYTGLAKPVTLYEPNSTTPVPGNRYDLDPNVHLDAAALKILSLFPCPNANGSTSAVNNCQVSRPLVDNTFQYDTRVDWNASAKDQAFARLSGSIEKEYHTPPLGPILDGGPFNDSGPSSFIGYNVAMSETHIFNPTLTNEARLGYNYGHFTLTPAGNTQNYANQLGLGGIPFGPNLGGMPIAGGVGQGSGTMNLFGSTNSTSFGTPSYTYTTEHQDISQILDNVTKVAGKHTLKFGVSVELIRFITLQPKNPVGGYNFTGVHTGGANGTVGSGLADFLTDQVNEAFISAISTSDQVRWDSAAFAQDDWTPTRKLTLNLGLRWEDPTSYRDLHGKQSNFVPTSPLGLNSGTANLLIPISEGTNSGVGTRFQAIAGPNVSVVYTPNQYLVSNAWRNFGPRLGAAYRLNDRSVIRAGYGFFYAGLESQGYGPNIGANFPFQTTNDYVSTGCSGPGAKCPVALSNLGNPITLETGFTDVLTTGFVNSVTAPVTNAINPRTQVPYTEDFNLTAEYALTNNMSAKVAYVGSQSHHTTTNRNINNAYALQKSGTNINATRPFPGLGNVGTLNYFGQSSYNSLQISADHRPSHGLAFSANYTYAHTVGLGGGGVDGGGVGIIDSPLFNYRNSFADAAIDVRHRVSINGSFELPFGENRRFLNHGGAVNLLVGGWNTSATYSAQTGIPFTVGLTNFSGFATAAGASGAAIMIADPFKPGGTPPANHPAASCPTKVRTRANWYNPCAFSNAPQSGANIPAGTFVTGAAALPYFGGHNNQIHGPGQQRANMSLFKNFVYREANSLQIRADVFNLFNTPSNTNPSNTGLTAAGGQISAPRSFQKDTPDSRFIQLAIKLSF
jgi:hypothetical protein